MKQAVWFSKGMVGIILVGMVLLFSQNLSAQVFKIELNGYSANVSGDITKNSMEDEGAGYVSEGFGSNLEFKYYYNHIGFGIRLDYVEYVRDNDAYTTDLKHYLGIVDENYSMTEEYSYYSYNIQFGLTYAYDLSRKFQLEPYFYFGFNTFISPIERAIYLKNGTTYTYRKDPVGYAGIGYVPGIKILWKISKHFGLNLAMEYEGVALSEESEEDLIYSYNSFTKHTVDKAYNPTSFNFGLGLTFSFGKGLEY